jgi:hypothetical protein
VLSCQQGNTAIKGLKSEDAAATAAGGPQPVQRVIIRAFHRDQQRAEGGCVAGDQFFPRDGCGGVALSLWANGAQNPHRLRDVRRRAGQNQTEATGQDQRS